MRPSRSATSPATVSYGPVGHLEADAAQGVDPAAAVGVPGGAAVLGRARRRVRAGRRLASCSSRTSPTSSSTMSSRVTTPAVPPYSSTTTAMGCSLRSRSSSGCTGSVSGTSSGGTAIRPTGVRSRSCGGHREGVLEVDHADDLVDALPVDGEAGEAGGPGEVERRPRRWPTDCRALTRTRGVITCCAVSSPSDRVRTKRSAVSCSRAPARAEWRARETSSPGVRAEASSSAGSTPSSADQPVGDRVEQPAMTGRKSAGEDVLRAGDEAGDLQRPGDRPVLGHEFADHHLDGGGEQHADRPRRRRGRRRRAARSR